MNAGEIQAPRAFLCPGGRRCTSEENCPSDPAGGGDGTEPWLFRFELCGLSSIASNVLFEYGIPAGCKVIGQLVTRVAIVKRQATGQNHHVRILILPKPVDDLSHQLQQSAGTLIASTIIPAFVMPTKNYG